MKKVLILISGLAIIAYPCVNATIASKDPHTPLKKTVMAKKKPVVNKTRIFHCFNYKLPARERKLGTVVSKTRLAAMRAKEIATVEIPYNQFARDAAYYCKKQYKLWPMAVISIVDNAGKLAFVGTARLTPKETARLDIKKVKFSK